MQLQMLLPGKLPTGYWPSLQRMALDTGSDTKPLIWATPANGIAAYILRLFLIKS